MQKQPKRTWTMPVNAIFSPDDEAKTGKGWYLQERGGDWRTSQLFKTEQSAWDAWRDGKIVWG